MGPQATKGLDRIFQEVYEKQKYLVIGSGRDYKEGDVINGVNWAIHKNGEDIRDDIPLRIIGNSNLEEMQSQFKLLQEEGEPDLFINYYRVVAE